MARRRSTEETPSYFLKRPIFETDNLNLLNYNCKDDFSDVFGGPPRTLHPSGANFFYAARTDDDVSRSRSRSTMSKSKSSSGLSPSYSFSAFNSNISSSPAQNLPFYAKKQCMKKNCYVSAAMMMMSSNNLSFSRRVLSPERDLDSFTNLKQIGEDYELCSRPSSSAKASVISNNEEDCCDDNDIDDIMSSYVIEINDFNSDDPREETVEAVGVDEAIAWAKQKYQSGIQLEKYQPANHPGPKVSASSQTTQMDEDLVSSSSLLVQEEEQKSMELLDEGIKLWSAYKETNIQLLLSTLHHILWSSSGWTMVSLADIIDSSKVKKAYQKARLCLHPDKLQQRGATPLQKYVAAEAFSILQAAWETFISHNSF